MSCCVLEFYERFYERARVQVRMKTAIMFALQLYVCLCYTNLGLAPPRVTSCVHDTTTTTMCVHKTRHHIYVRDTTS